MTTNNSAGPPQTSVYGGPAGFTDAILHSAVPPVPETGAEPTRQELCDSQQTRHSDTDSGAESGAVAAGGRVRAFLATLTAAELARVAGAARLAAGAGRGGGGPVGMTLPPDLARKVLALAARPATVVRSAHSSAGSWRLTVRVPGLSVVSEANRRGHWTARAKRAKCQRSGRAGRARRVPGAGPSVTVTLTRIGGRRMDDDNLAGAFKAARDAVASWLGVDDGDAAAVRWVYRQRPGGKVAGVVVTVTPRRRV